MHPCAVGLSPDHLVWGRSKQRPNRQWQSVSAQKAHHAACTLQLPELGEDELQSCLHFFVRMENDGACAVIGEAAGERQAEFAARRLLALALMKTHSDLVKLCLTHDPGQAEQ